MNHKDLLTFDIYRSIVLSKYIEQWGQPLERTIFTHDHFANIEIYSFPATSKQSIHRLVTIGAGLVHQHHTDPVNFEYCFIFGEHLNEEQEAQMVEYLMNITTHLTTHRPNNTFRLISESHLTPAFLKLPAILVDEARGECESLSELHISDQLNHSCLMWLIPLYASEAALILEQGIDAFSELEEQYEFSMIDFHRPKIV